MLPAPPISIEEEAVRPTHVEVDLRRLTANLAAIRAHIGQSQAQTQAQTQAGAPVRVMTILKANAYGHGLLPVAKHMVACGADYLGVAFLEEGILLRRAGITTPILVLGGIAGEQIPLFLRHDLTLTAPSVEKLRLIDEAAAALRLKARVHLKIDTGMERIGVHYYSAGPLLEASLAARHITVEGIYSHFANADTADLTHARLQLQRFQEVLTFYEKRSLPTPLRHIANSAGILQLPESHLDLVRPGILLYGVYPSAETARTIPVQPALTWKSRVAYFKVVQPHHPVSYGSTWETPEPTRIVTIPVGYGDGYFRALSNRAQVIIRGQRHPIVGRICMDQTLVDVGPTGTAYNGDEVILLGQDGEGEAITAADLAEWASTIPYEVLTNINTRVPRVYCDGKLEDGE